MKNYGFIPSKKDLRNYKLNKKLVKNISLPDKFEVNHSPIKNQGKVCSCVAHSVSEVFEAVYSEKQFSTDWIYGYRPFGYAQGEGMMISNALKTVTKLGAAEEYILPTNTEMDMVKKLVNKYSDELKENAAKHKASKYARIFSVKALKESIYLTGVPAVLAIIIDDDGLKLDKKFVAAVPDKSDGGHAVVCYGWNEEGLLIQNSWGRKWGDNGTFVLPYDYKPVEMWSISFGEQVLVKPQMFALRELIHTIIKAIASLFSNK